ncbi:MAG TPA: tail fiber protein [Myxococcales bacterium]|jgi:microcystin-dependent protein|nr:tail fiber protein [Myxococcales bacterium]
MSEPFIGQIQLFGGNFAPRGWALCNGQLLSIAQNTALFSILGTTYGGDGQTTFALPNLQGRFPMHWGNGPGLTPRTLGEVSGSESVTLLTSQMPSHNHVVNATGQDGNTDVPTSALWAKAVDGSSNAVSAYSSGVNPDTTMNPAAIGPSGGNQPTPVMNPFLCVTFIIALEGIFPSRS